MRYINSNVFQFVKDHSIKIMPMVTNRRFDKVETQKLLSNPAAQKKAIQRLVDTCKKYHFYGVQIDFENISVKNKDRLTSFYKQVAEALHNNGFKISVAVVPAVSDSLDSSPFLNRKY